MSAQSGAAGVVPSTEEATAFIKGKSLSATRLAGGTPSLQFKDNGTMYGKNGNNGGGSDSGKWRVEDGKLCMRWQRWEYEGCGQLVRVGDKVQHLYPNTGAVGTVMDSPKCATTIVSSGASRITWRMPVSIPSRLPRICTGRCTRAVFQPATDSSSANTASKRLRRSVITWSASREKNPVIPAAPANHIVDGGVFAL